MAKIKFIFEELYRSFWGGWLKDILLMAMFCISLVMAVLMCSYYFDLGEREPNEVNYDNSAWYQFGVAFAEDTSQEDYMNSLQTASGCQNMMDYYGALCHSREHPILTTYRKEILLEEGEMEALFGEHDFGSFLQEGMGESFSVFDMQGGTCLVWSLRAYAVNAGAYRQLGLKAVEGEGFTEEGLSIRSAEEGIPVLVGYGYKDILSVGQAFEVKGTYGSYRCRVAGILEKGAQFPESDFSGVETVPMDSYILFPTDVQVKEVREGKEGSGGVQVKEGAKDMRVLQELAWGCIQALSSGKGVIRIGRKDRLKQAVEEVRQIGESYGLPPIKIFGASMGMNLFRKESAVRIRVMMILTIVLSCFTFYGLFVTFYDKIQSNRRVYGIYLMNGCPMGLLLLPCLMEIAVILLPAVFASGYVFTADSVGGGDVRVVLGAAYGLAGAAFLVGVGFLFYLMRGVDTERLIRQKE